MLSCSQRNKGLTTIEVNVENRPLLHGEGISQLISDSGVTRFHLEAEIWDAYANDTTSYWFFPKGIYVEQYDSLFQVSGYVRADTAYCYDRMGLWHLIHNVVVRNAEGTTTFETSELFWNQKEPATSRESIYTDKFVKITTPIEVITSKGIKSNQSLTKYILYENGFEKEIDEVNSTEE